MKKSYTLKLEGKQWTECLDKAFELKKKDAKVDGFRKGQVTKEIYIKKFGIESLYMDAVDNAVDILYTQLMEDKDTIIPAATPEISVNDINKDYIEVEFTIVSAPEIKLGKYKDLKIKKDKVEVTDEEIESEITSLKEQFVDLKTIDEKIKEGNIAVIDFEGFKDNVPFKGGKGENYSLEIGSHTFIPGFEEALVGLKTGDKKDIDITFPENYHSEELKGAPVVFKVEVKEVKEKVYPEFNDEFFEDLNLPEVKTLEDLKNYIKESKTAEKEFAINDEHLFKCLDKILESAEFEIPEEMTNEEVERLVKEFSSKLQMQGMKLEDYLKFCNTDMDGLKEQLKDEADKRISYRLVIDEIIKLEKIEVSEEELNEQIKNTCEKYQITEEEFLKQSPKDLFKYDMLMRKAMEIVTGEKQEK